MYANARHNLMGLSFANRFIVSIKSKYCFFGFVWLLYLDIWQAMFKKIFYVNARLWFSDVVCYPTRLRGTITQRSFANGKVFGENYKQNGEMFFFLVSNLWREKYFGKDGFLRIYYFHKWSSEMHNLKFHENFANPYIPFLSVRPFYI